MNYFKVNGLRFESEESKIIGKNILQKADLTPFEDYEILQRVNEKGYTPIQLSEEVNLKEVGIEGFIAKPYRKISIKVDDCSYETDECFLTPNEILSIAGINADHFYLQEIRKGDVEVTYKDDVEHKIAIRNNSCFVSCERDEIECVIVNAKVKPWTKRKISFEEVVTLEYGSLMWSIL
jgi:hypothetical protein